MALRAYVLWSRSAAMHSKHLSNEELLAALAEALRQEGTLIARVVSMLIDVEERRLHLEAACSSMFEFCRRKLGMSEGEAFRRTHAARLAKRFPAVLEALHTRRIHLSSLVAMKDILTAANVDTLLAEAAGKTKRVVQELVARYAPKPDVPARIRKLPDPKPAVTTAPVAPPPAPADPKPAVTTAPVAPPPAPVAPPPAPAPRPERVRVPTPKRVQLLPLSEARHKVEFTASSEFRDEIEYAQSLMRHCNIDGDLSVVFRRAIRLLVVDLEKRKLAATTRERKTSTSPKDGDVNVAALAPTRVTASVKREVIRRDQAQCSFVSASGERCAARELLEIDHRHPRALGGSNDAANLRLLCRAHNQLEAERVFGREHIARAIHVRQRKQPAPPDPGAQRPHGIT